ncbi:MAG: hypothetical protein ACFFDH_03370 [Promethearchaeota archaeon]
MREKNWTQLSYEILSKRYAHFLRELWYSGFSNLNSSKLFRNKKGTKEKIKVGKYIFDIKLKKKVKK